MASFNLDNTINALQGASNALTGNGGSSNQNAPSIPQADGSGLPFSKINPNNTGIIKRSNITWFIPQFGIVKMFINPQSISYQEKKLISSERTKGGYTLQYWGEELIQLDINGTTGSSGVEGINALREIYRAEQYAFDATGLVLDANNASADVANNLVQGIGGALGKGIGIGASGGAGLLGGILGLDSPNNQLSARNIPSLAQLAFTVEMFYDGWVFRGFFKDMTMTEQANDFLWNYKITFMATQKRGYRTNYLPFQRSANTGPSQYNTPFSFNGNTGSGQF